MIHTSPVSFREKMAKTDRLKNQLSHVTVIINKCLYAKGTTEPEHVMTDRQQSNVGTHYTPDYEFTFPMAQRARDIYKNKAIM